MSMVNTFTLKKLEWLTVPKRGSTGKARRATFMRHKSGSGLGASFVHITYLSIVSDVRTFRYTYDPDSDPDL